MDVRSGISKDAAVELLQKAGYESYLEDGVVFVKWNDDPNLPDTIADFLRSHGYMASYGIKGRAKGGSPAITVSDVTAIEDGNAGESPTESDESQDGFSNLFDVS